MKCFWGDASWLSEMPINEYQRAVGTAAPRKKPAGNYQTKKPAGNYQKKEIRTKATDKERKKAYSRVYHKTIRMSRNAGCTEPECKKKASLAAQLHVKNLWNK